MKIIVGFGNIGNSYNFTRHNFGFLTLDFYAKIKNLAWESNPKYNAIYLKTTPEELEISAQDPRETIYFIKPQGFYNNSGMPTADFARFYKVPHQNILAVCDDFNLTFGTTRIREKGTDGGNNGLKSCIKELGGTDFPRLRLGTANDALRRKLGDTDFVLGKFTPEERENLPPILREACAKIDDFIKSS